jgi:hypothetical protein
MNTVNKKCIQNIWTKTMKGRHLFGDLDTDKEYVIKVDMRAVVFECVYYVQLYGLHKYSSKYILS